MDMNQQNFVIYFVGYKIVKVNITRRKVELWFNVIIEIFSKQ